MKQIYYYIARKKDIVVDLSRMTYGDFVDIFPFYYISTNHWSVVFSRTVATGEKCRSSFTNLAMLISDVDLGPAVLTNNQESRPTIFRKVRKEERWCSSSEELEVMPLKWYCPFYRDVYYSEIKAIFKYFLEEK